MKKSLIVFLTTISFWAFGQNLLPNPSFETSATDEPKKLDGDNNFTCLEWKSPTFGTPDYFTKKREGTIFGFTNNIGEGNIEPYDGDAYAGLAVNTWGLDLYEYLQAKLTQKLIQGKKYCLTIHLALGRRQLFTTNEFNYIFSDESIEELTVQRLHLSKFETFKDTSSYFMPNCWNKMSACYVAKGNEEYLTFGVINKTYRHINLTKDEDRKYSGIYFFVDDLSLKEVSDTVECDCNMLKAINPFDKAVSKSMILKNITFENNKTELLSVSFPELNKLAAYLKSNTTFKIEIIGYTDNIGKESANIKLSKGRAKSVADYLIKEGISKDRIKSSGFGSKEPLKPNDTYENRQLNRRVEFKVIR